MSHFCVYVFYNADDASEKAVESLLAPYDESRIMDEPVVALTREEAIAKSRAWTEKYKNTVYARYLECPEKYKAEHSHVPEHIKYLAEEFAARLNWTDEECYQDEKSWYEDNMVAENGDLMTTCNPEAHWDWWKEGGRWSGALTGDDQVTSARVGELDLSKIDVPYAFVKPDGEWCERGSMGWFGMSSGDAPIDEWSKTFMAYIRSLPKDTWVTQDDCHI